MMKLFVMLCLMLLPTVSYAVGVEVPLKTVLVLSNVEVIDRIDLRIGEAHHKVLPNNSKLEGYLKSKVKSEFPDISFSKVSHVTDGVSNVIDMICRFKTNYEKNINGVFYFDCSLVQRSSGEILLSSYELFLWNSLLKLDGIPESLADSAVEKLSLDFYRIKSEAERLGVGSE